MEIKVLGSGCANCNKLEKMVVEVLSELSEKTEVAHVRDFKEIASYGVMRTPALVINGQVKFSGLIPSRDKLKEVISGEIAKRG
jgi:small redox-active disulfide protein 2